MKVQQCLGLTEDGTRCNRLTSHPLGFCEAHLKQKFGLHFRETILRCRECIASECKFRNYSDIGLCYFELFDALEFDEKDKVGEGMRRVLQSEFRHLERLERIIVKDVENKELLELYRKLASNLMEHLHILARFEGWEEPRIAIEERRSRLKMLEKIFGKESKKESNKQRKDELIAKIMEEEDEADLSD